MTRVGAALVLLLLAVAATAQRCELWAGDPPECAPALTGTQVYLFGPLSQTDTADQIRNLTAQITSLVASVFPKCAEVALPFACKNAFPKCVMVNDTIGDVPVFEAQCRATCGAVNDQCSLAYQLAGAAPTNCTASNPFAPSFEFYPTTSLSFPLPSGAQYAQPCDAQLVAPVQCPMTYLGVRLAPIPAKDLGVIKAGNISLPCWKCPFPAFYSERDLHAAWYGSAVIGAVSIVLTLFTLVPIILTPERRAFPAIIPLYLAITGHALGWTWVATAMRGHEKTYCDNEYTASTTSNPACVIQGFCLLVFSLGSIFWTTAIIFNVFWAVVLRKEVQKWWHFWQIGVCWGYPLLSGIIFVAARQAYYGGGNNCFIGDYHPGTTNSLSDWWFSYSLWYIPISLLLITNVCMIVCIVITCFKGAKDWQMARRLLFNQWRTFAYFAFFFYTAGYVVFLWVNVLTIRDEVSGAVAVYVQCLFTAADSTECEPTKKTPVKALVGLAWTNAFIGIWFFMIFGMSRENMRWWRRLIAQVLKGDFSTFSGSKSRSSTDGSSSRPVTAGSMMAPDNASNAISRL